MLKKDFLMRSTYWLSAVLLVLAACGDDDASTMDASVDATVDATVDAMPDRMAVDAQPVPTVCTAGATLGRSCTSAEQCTDACFCNGIELCQEGVCVAAPDSNPCADEVDCTEDLCDEEADTCNITPRNEVCADADLCNGEEICDPEIGCIDGFPLACSDMDACTLDSCDPMMGCGFTLRDLDGDGFPDDRCMGGDDCNDDPVNGAAINPAAVEICDNGIDDNCNRQTDIADPACSPTNDDCGTAFLLPGAGTYDWVMNGLGSDISLSCDSTGTDAVFRFNLPAPRDITVSVSGGGSGTGVALREFATCAAGPDLRCANTTSPSIDRRSVPAGDYAIIVKTTSASATFSLTLGITSPTPPPAFDRCDASTTDASMGGSFTGAFADIEDDYPWLGCHTSSSGGKDAVYALNLASPKDVSISAQAFSSSGFNTTVGVALINNCATPSPEIGCVSRSSSLGSNINVRDLPAGNYWIMVESRFSSAFTFSLDVSVTDPTPRPAGDLCSSALDITDTMRSIDIAQLSNDGGLGCGGDVEPYRDGFFSFTLTETRDVTVTTTAPGVHLMSIAEPACGVPADEFVCRSGVPSATESFRRLAAGTYYVATAIPAATGSISAIAMTSAPTPAPPNDACASAAPLPSGTAVTGSFIDYTDTATNLCAGSGGNEDSFYTFTLATPTLVTITASSSGGSEPVALTLRDSCGSTMNTCDTGATAAIAQMLAAGTYIVAVEPAGAVPFTYTLQAFY